MLKRKLHFITCYMVFIKSILVWPLFFQNPYETWVSDKNTHTTLITGFSLSTDRQRLHIVWKCLPLCAFSVSCEHLLCLFAPPPIIHYTYLLSFTNPVTEKYGLCLTWPCVCGPCGPSQPPRSNTRCGSCLSSWQRLLSWPGTVLWSYWWGFLQDDTRRKRN